MRIPELDGLRALAILPVLGFHSREGLVIGGYLGVDVFFVLSGFLITSLLMQEEEGTGTVSLHRFYARRALRILPPLFAAIALAAILSNTPASGMLAAALFYANLVDYRDLDSLSHTWSLAIEEHFYFAWPPLFLVLGRWRTGFLVGIAGFALFLRLYLVQAGVDDETIYRITPTRMDSLAIGCIAALWRPHVPLALGPAGIALMLACFVTVPKEAMLSPAPTVFALLCAVVVLAAQGASDVLRWPALQYIGTRSYGLYLYHLPIFNALEPLRESGSLSSFMWVNLAKFAMTFAVAEISYRTIERYAATARARFRGAAL